MEKISRVCVDCKIEQPIIEFSNKVSGKIVRTHCRLCKNKRLRDKLNTNPELKKANSQRGVDYYNARKNDESFKLKRRERFKVYRQKNKKYYSDYCKSNIEYYRQLHRMLREKNRGTYNAYSAKRRAIKLNATPKWLTEKEHNDIRRFYKVSSYLTKCSGTRYNVDHIYPLSGSDTCGLHVPWNLQIITASENFTKRNNFNLLLPPYFYEKEPQKSEQGYQ